MAESSFHLVMQQGPTPGQVVEVSGPEFLIGRDPACDLVISDIEVSRRHCHLIAQSTGYLIEDMGSTNGTYVEGERVITVRPLRHGDTIQMGENVRLRYEVEEGEGATRTMRVSSLLKTPQWEELPEEPIEEKQAQQAFEGPPTPRAHQPAAAQVDASPATAAPASAPARRGDGAPRQRMDWAKRLGRGARVAPTDGQPIWRRPWFLIVAVIAIFGACGLTAFLWYVDANYLWCDVFGNLLAACRVP